MAIINFVRDYERVARFRLGRFEGMMGPGVVFAFPILDQIIKVDTRTQIIDIPRQTVITKDHAPIEIDFLVCMRVDMNQAERAVLEVENYRAAVVGLATTAMRTAIGDIKLKDVESQLDRIAGKIRGHLDHETERWGIKVTNLEIGEIERPRNVQEAMSHPNEDVVRRAFSAGDMDTLRTLLTEDAVWHVAGHNQLSGERRGVDAILGYFGELAEATGGTSRVDELHAVLANDEYAVGLQRRAAEKEGQTQYFNEVLVMRMRDGKIVEAWEHPGDAQAYDEFIG